jgi:Fur family ferric uptake transcriptional regulator
MVLSALHDVDVLATAEMIHERVQAYTSSIDISTVYRTLELLRELNLVTCLELGGDQRKYELVTLHEPHIHLVCRTCDRIIPADLAAAAPFVQKIQKDYGFAVDLGQFSVPGRCRECAQLEVE